MENGEMKFSKKDETDQSGYSEKKLDQNTDLQAGQWLDLNQGTSTTTVKSHKSTDIKKQKIDKKPQNIVPIVKQSFVNSSDTYEKISRALQEVSNALVTEIEAYVSLVQEHTDQAEDGLKKIIELQTTQKSLLQALRWEAKGSLDVSKLPKQVQNLLK